MEGVGAAWNTIWCKLRIIFSQSGTCYWTQVLPLPNSEKNMSTPWFHLSPFLEAGTRQSPTVWMFSFDNYAHQSLDHRQKLIRMRLGPRVFIYGKNGLKTLLQMHTPISQVKSAPTPAGEPNVRAEAEKRKKYMYTKMPNPVQPTSISQRTSKK